MASTSNQIKHDLKKICEDTYTKNFFKEIGLGNFYRTHKAVSLKESLQPYISQRRLANYNLLEKNYYCNLVPNKTYIKYISIDKAFTDKKYDSHIKSGGILIGCGMVCDNKFVSCDDPAKWTYLLLKFDPSAIVNNNGKVVRDRIRPRTFVIKISKCYLFYKLFVNNKRDYMNRIKVELIEHKDTNGKRI